MIANNTQYSREILHFHDRSLPEPGSLAGYAALPGGERNYSPGNFHYLGGHSSFWSATEEYTFNAWYREMHITSSKIWRGTELKNSGFSVRCVKD